MDTLHPHYINIWSFRLPSYHPLFKQSASFGRYILYPELAAIVLSFWIELLPKVSTGPSASVFYLSPSDLFIKFCYIFRIVSLQGRFCNLNWQSNKVNKSNITQQINRSVLWYNRIVMKVPLFIPYITYMICFRLWKLMMIQYYLQLIWLVWDLIQESALDIKYQSRLIK